MRYHLIPGRVAINKIFKNNKCWRGCGGKGTLLHPFWECKLIQPLCRTVCRYLRKLGIKPPYDPAIHCQAYTLRKPKLKKTCVTQCSFRTWKQPRYPSTDEWIKKLLYIYTMEYYSAIKVHALESVLMRQMNLESIIQNEVRKRKAIIIY